jgi:hypothetical protein
MLKSQKVNVDIDLILRDPMNERLLLTLGDFARTLERYGLNVRVCNTASLAKLLETPDVKKEQIRSHFELWNSWVRPESSGTKEIKLDTDKEKSFLKRALEHYGVWIYDDFWKTIDSNQVIELYGSDMVQLYRNLRFFHFCGYSLLEISVFEWYTLWERPSAVQQEMMAAAETAMKEPTPVMPYHVPRHVLRDRGSSNQMTDDFVPHACLVDFKYIGSIMKSVEPKPVGAIATAVGELIASGEEATTIQFV